MTGLLITLYYALGIYLLLLIARVILDLVTVIARDWRPTGAFLVLANVVYRVTDPPLRFLSRHIPPLPLGAIRLDMGFIVLFFGINILQAVIVRFI